MQAEDHPFHKVLDVALLRATDKHHPVMSEPFGGGLFPQLGPVPQLQFDLNRALFEDRGKAISKMEQITWDA